MNFELYSSKEDSINKRNTIMSSIDNLLDLYESRNEVMVCSDGFDIKEDRILLGIPTPLLVLSNEGVYTSYLNYLHHNYKDRKIQKKNSYLDGHEFIIDDILEDNSKLVYSGDSKKMRNGLFSAEDKILVIEGRGLENRPEIINEYFKSEEISLTEKDLLRTSLVQRVFQTGQIFYTPYYRSSRDLGDFFKALYNYIEN